MKYLLCSLLLVLSGLSYAQCSLDLYGLSYHGANTGQNQRNPGVGFNCGKKESHWSVVGAYIHKNSYQESGYLLGAEYRIRHNGGKTRYFYGGRAFVATGYAHTKISKRFVFAPFFTFGAGRGKWEINFAVNPKLGAFYVTRNF